MADFIAGFASAYTGHDDKAILEGCYKDTPEFRADVCDIYANIITKDNRKVLAALQKFNGELPLIRHFMEPCEG